MSNSDKYSQCNTAMIRRVLLQFPSSESFFLLVTYLRTTLKTDTWCQSKHQTVILLLVLSAGHAGDLINQER